MNKHSMRGSAVFYNPASNKIMLVDYFTVGIWGAIYRNNQMFKYSGHAFHPSRLGWELLGDL